MNIDEAKSIPLPEILSRLGLAPQRTTSTKVLYSSPLRQEKTPSFWVYLHTNSWYDYGEGIGGDVVRLVCEYLKACRQDHTVADALRWIQNMMGGTYPIAPLMEQEENEQPAATLILKTKKPIQHLGLVKYLHKRGIPVSIARHYLKEIQVQHTQTKKSFVALGFENEEGGYELRNPFFKGCLRPKAISFLRGSLPKPQSLHLFEGFMDYLSAVTHNGQALKGDAIVLNSLACLKQALPYIQDYGYQLVYTWLDNDAAGEKATTALAEFFKTQEGLTHQPMNKLYAPHQDVNAWHVHQLALGA